eukprot:gnl/MRDRNA2_/MRDRNA2_108517_c0_seq1.p1 gnl/MRDRNA2_/MRDRNA2_108517_c0~~gnl/MRDRNA2_/MRDRNA2_108517_c0_seq1.p1  ORF type:complete len:318 (-),score=31.32 gnl/MRDRNA2_/MRDRNA2_108517_c0_seq1:125-1000(-)
MVRKSRVSRTSRREQALEKRSTVEDSCATQSSTVEQPCAIGTLDVLGKIPYGCMHRILRHISVYDRCCFGAACCQMQTAVVAVGADNPVTEIEADPGSLVTPSFCRFLSAMLQFYLPRACPHDIVSHHYGGGSHTFVCHACKGALRFERKAWQSTLPVAFSIGLGSTALRKHCLEYINAPEQPKLVTTPDVMYSVKSGYRSDVVLKPNSKSSDAAKEVETQWGSVGEQQASRDWGPRCTCHVCSPDLGPSDYEYEGLARTGRTKGRRRKKGSRLERAFEVCPYAQNCFECN